MTGIPTDEELLPARQVVLERARQAGLSVAPKIGVVLGSGLGGFADGLAKRVSIDYSELPGMATSSVSGHSGTLHLGQLAGGETDSQTESGTASGSGSAPPQLACMQGRLHLYEGHPMKTVVFGACLLTTLGCEAVLLTNAAGGIADDLEPGDLMLIEDHINLTGHNPLVGPLAGSSKPGPRFVDMSEAYDSLLRASATAAMAATNHELGEPGTLRRGVYAGLLGPSYETPAEIRMLRTLGAAAVGMSTVLEVIALRQRDVRVGAVSCITNKAAGLGHTRLDHDDVKRTAAMVQRRFEAFLRHWVSLCDAALERD